ncbi:MAG: DUF2877 domain-containing protein [Nitrospinota bacterium]|nr:MAG: DUF2877 domain-containing protein [Nitrospinota bacterium]
MEATVKRWTRAAAALLCSQSFLRGQVHSCYARIINVRTPAGRLLSLQEDGYLQSPLSLILDYDIEALTATLSPLPDRPVTLYLRHTGAEEWNGHLDPLPSLPARIWSQIADALTSWILTHVPERGLAPLLRTQEDCRVALPPLCRRVSPLLTPLLQSREGSTDSLLHLAHNLIGLGPGLTPSGDDLLLGLLAVLQISGRREMLFPAPAQQAFLHRVKTQTTDLSAEFLRCALEGNFAEPLAFFIRSLIPGDPSWPSRAKALAAVGHSSGVDTLVGIVTGCRLLKISNE